MRPEIRSLISCPEPQAGPEGGLLNVAAEREQIAHHHLQGFATRLQQRFIKTDDLGHTADANALIETGDGDFIGLIKDSGNRRAVFLGNRDG